MIKSLVVFVATIVGLFFLPMDLYIVTVLALYGLVVIYEWAFKDIQVLDLAFFIIYIGINIIYYFLGFKNIVPFTGTLFYGVLFLVSFQGVITGKPWTLQKYRRWKKDLRESHLATAVIMSLGYGLALWFSLRLFPSSTYIWVPLVITGITVPLSIFAADLLVEWYWTLVAMIFTPLDQRRNIKAAFGSLRGFGASSGSYVAKEVVTDGDRDLFFKALCQGYSQIRHREGETPEVFEKNIREEYELHGERTFAAVVLDTRTQKPVGTIRLVWAKGSSHNLPLESFIPFTPGVRGSGVRIGEVGRLAILENGPGKARILELLIQLFIVKCLFLRIHTLYTDALGSAVPLYRKMGLMEKSGPFMDQEFHQESYLMELSIPKILTETTTTVWERMKSHPFARRTISGYLKKVGVQA